MGIRSAASLCEFFLQHGTGLLHKYATAPQCLHMEQGVEAFAYAPSMRRAQGALPQEQYSDAQPVGILHLRIGLCGHIVVSPTSTCRLCIDRLYSI
ncbi:hypothetical protein KL86DES1_10742 [uncultured Desulfovibrio sp.]|uniref:Uncharacterized protein n=1 Tax=uncultured Desulfovibrio sp. TaxID=167968 RepID=A0A212L0E0_9BACT|nr:hypothetical protein KL86DES1_10742 [uncultured Desulfovibrio sp.]VZH32616.1 conserved protein of unknown function [Desulfovibrio sp. 86]